MRNTNRYYISVLVVMLVASSANGQGNTWTVREYGGPGGSDCGCYTYDDQAYTIVLTENPGEGRELKFEVYWADAGGNYVSEAPLNNLTIRPDVDQDLIEISILGDPAAEDPVHEYGASTIARMNIRDGNFGECRLTGLKISDDIATTDDVICENITGDVDIGDDLGIIANTTKLSADTVTGTITIRGKIVSGDSLEANTLGDVSIHSHPMQGNIKIKNDYAGTLTIYPIMYGDIRIGERDQEGNITTPSDLTGTLDFRSQLVGDVDITADVATGEGVSGRILVGVHLNGGHILVSGAVTQADATLPAMHVHGDITSYSSSGEPRIKVVGQLGGVIAVDGDVDLADLASLLGVYGTTCD